METRKETIKRLAKEEAKANRLNYPTIALEEAAFIRGTEWADAHPIHYDGQAMLHVLHKGVKQGKEEMIGNVLEWLKAHISDYIVLSRNIDYMFDDLKKAMEDKR